MEGGVGTDPRVLCVLDGHFVMMRCTHSLIHFCFKDKLTFPYGEINEIKLTIILFFYLILFSNIHTTLNNCGFCSWSKVGRKWLSYFVPLPFLFGNRYTRWRETNSTLQQTLWEVHGHGESIRRCSEQKVNPRRIWEKMWGWPWTHHSCAVGAQSLVLSNS